MSAMASQITGVSIDYSTVCSGANQRKHQSSASLAFVRGIHRWPVNSPHKGSVTRKCFHLMTSSWHFPVVQWQAIWWLLCFRGNFISIQKVLLTQVHSQSQQARSDWNTVGFICHNKVHDLLIKIQVINNLQLSNRNSHCFSNKLSPILQQSTDNDGKSWRVLLLWWRHAMETLSALLHHLWEESTRHQ